MDPNDPVDILARTLWGEARNQGHDGMAAVASAIMNRVAWPGYWGRSVIGVCQHPWAFSCWNADDPNRAKLEAVDDTDPIFVDALNIAGQWIAGGRDTVQGSCFYKRSDAPWPHDWPTEQAPTIVVGAHAFYNFGRER